MRTFDLKDGNKIPALGFGTWKLSGEECTSAVKDAIRIGYRHLDTADMYGNHKEVGEGIKQSGIERSELFITTKIPPHDLSPTAIKNNCETYLTELGIDYIDLFLIHWPNRQYSIGQTLATMQELKDAGRVRSIGVSNFTIHHLEDVKESGIEIVNNQVEMHILFNQIELREYCKKNGIVITAYCPLGRGKNLENDTLSKIATKYNATPAQISLAWVMAKGVVAIPKSSKTDRIQENFDSLNIELNEEDIALIDKIPQGERLVLASWNEFDY